MDRQTRFVSVAVGFCVVLIAATGCAGPVPPGAALTTVPMTVTARPTTATAATSAPSATAAPTAQSSSPTGTPPAGGLSETELKYRLINQYGEIFYCDPDQFPVARGDQAELAARAVPALKQNDPDKYQVILKHLGLGPAAALDSGQAVAVYLESKKLNALVLTVTGASFKFALRISDTTGAKGKGGFAVEGSIGRGGEIVETKKEPAFLQCPICLAADALIDTPAGRIAVSALKVGMPVWTQDKEGGRVAGVVAQTAHVAVPATHQVVRVRLADGREVRVSPGHPTADGRRVGDLASGDVLDGARVVSVEREAYPDGATYDLLPSGGAGTYWANGILLGSTLR